MDTIILKEVFMLVLKMIATLLLIAGSFKMLGAMIHINQGIGRFLCGMAIVAHFILIMALWFNDPL